jgi:hypothetical protein
MASPNSQEELRMQKILWEDEKSYLEDEIKTLESAYKEVAVEKGKFHKLYLALKEEKEAAKRDEESRLDNVTRSPTDLGSMTRVKVTDVTTGADTPPGNKSTIVCKDEIHGDTNVSPATDVAEPFSYSAADLESPEPKFYSKVNISGWLSISRDTEMYSAERWVTVKGNMMCLYIDSFASVPVCGFQLFSNTVVSIPKSSPKNRALGVSPHQFVIQSPDNFLQYRFVCKNRKDLEYWVDSLKNVCSCTKSDDGNNPSTSLFPPKESSAEQRKSLLEDCRQQYGGDLTTRMDQIFLVMEEEYEESIQKFITGAVEKGTTLGPADVDSRGSSRVNTTQRVLAELDSEALINDVRNNENKAKLMAIGQRVKALKLLKSRVAQIKRSIKSP